MISKHVTRYALTAACALALSTSVFAQGAATGGGGPTNPGGTPTGTPGAPMGDTPAKGMSGTGMMSKNKMHGAGASGMAASAAGTNDSGKAGAGGSK